MRTLVATVVLAGAAVALVPAQRSGRISTEAQCAATLGVGVKTKRTFCDVLIGTKPAESIYMPIPTHAGAATLQFDLHNRFAVPAVVVPSPLTYARQEALILVIRTNGVVIDRAAVAGEFRTPADLFDQITGGGRSGGVRGIAPGPAEPIRVNIPVGVAAIGIVGTRQKVQARGNDEVFDTPGRPVAVVSNLRIEYRPAP